MSSVDMIAIQENSGGVGEGGGGWRLSANKIQGRGGRCGARESNRSGERRGVVVRGAGGSRSQEHRASVHTLGGCGHGCGGGGWGEGGGGVGVVDGNGGGWGWVWAWFQVWV